MINSISLIFYPPPTPHTQYGNKYICRNHTHTTIAWHPHASIAPARISHTHTSTRQQPLSSPDHPSPDPHTQTSTTQRHHSSTAPARTQTPTTQRTLHRRNRWWVSILLVAPLHHLNFMLLFHSNKHHNYHDHIGWHFFNYPSLVPFSMWSLVPGMSLVLDADQNAILASIFFATDRLPPSHPGWHGDWHHPRHIHTRVLLSYLAVSPTFNTTCTCSVYRFSCRNKRLLYVSPATLLPPQDHQELCSPTARRSFSSLAGQRENLNFII